jgi:transposase
MSDNKELPDTARKGSNTTGFLFDSPDAPIALYISGRQHAGENLQDILQSRPKELGPMHVMADGSSNNNPKELNLNIIMHNCLTHGMRKFTDLGDYYSKECLKIIEFFSNVYKNDRHAKNEGMSDKERQKHHEKYSTPIMRELKEYLTTLLKDKKKCEPNGELYRAINYVLKRWEELTHFLSVPGAPLDSNSVEQLLKVIIRVRKTAMFYKTENSAFISSAILSLIKTSVINDVNPLQYLILPYNDMKVMSSNHLKNGSLGIITNG